MLHASAVQVSGAEVMRVAKQLSEKQERWALCYVEVANGAEAARRACYKWPEKAGSKNLKNQAVMARVAELTEQHRKDSIATAEEVLVYLTSVLRGESESEVVVVEGIGDGCSEARRIKKLPDEKERLKAGELLGKRYGILTEKVMVGEAPKVVDDI